MSQKLLLEEQLSRNAQFFGKSSQEKIQDSFVIVVGAGGVGSHAAHILARSGVGRLRIIDFDNVTLSSLNRHAVATRADVGLPKVDVCRQHFEKFMPGDSCKIEPVNRMFTAEAADELLGGNPDFVVDAIDDTDTKTDLIKICRDKQLRFIVCMGAGAKADPTRLHISDISDSLADPLAVKVRSLLKAKGVSFAKYTSVSEALEDGIPCIYSSEKSSRKLLDLTEEQKQRGASEFGAMDNFRVRIMPVLGTIPAIFGMAIASYVLTQLAGQPFLPSAMPPVTKNVAHTHLQRYKKREMSSPGPTIKMVDEKECGYVIGEIWRQRCAYSGARLGHNNPVHASVISVNDNGTCDVKYMDGTGKLKLRVPRSQLLDTKNGNRGVGADVTVGQEVLAIIKGARFTLTRWDRSKPSTVDNLLFLTEDMASLHDEATLKTGSTPEPLSLSTSENGLSPVHDPKFLNWIKMTLSLARAEGSGFPSSIQKIPNDENNLLSSSRLMNLGILGFGAVLGFCFARWKS